MRGSTQRPNYISGDAPTLPMCDPKKKAAALSGPRQGMRVREPGRGIAVHMSPGPMRGNISYPQDYQFVRTVVKHEKSHH